MHLVILKGEEDIKIARERLFSSNVDIEDMLGLWALCSGLFLPLK